MERCHAYGVRLADGISISGMTAMVTKSFTVFVHVIDPCELLDNARAAVASLSQPSDGEKSSIIVLSKEPTSATRR